MRMIKAQSYTLTAVYLWSLACCQYISVLVCCRSTCSTCRAPPEVPKQSHVQKAFPVQGSKVSEQSYIYIYVYGLGKFDVFLCEFFAAHGRRPAGTAAAPSRVPRK